ncbi:MAG: hypothetical protein IOMNBAOH_02830 [Rhodocyclaceae bacterium]|nr:hypothetical protein [Rhodocyclaceae bacterium]
MHGTAVRKKTLRYTWTPGGRLAQLQDAAGLTLDGAYLDGHYATWDELDRLERRVDYAGHATLTQYDPLGRVSQVTEADGYTLAFDRDPLGRVTGAYDQQGHRVSLTLDASGRPRRVTDPNGLTTQYDHFHAAEDGRLKTTEEMTGFWRVLALGLSLTALAGCGGPDERLQALNARIRALDGQMKLGEVREVPLPPIKQGEWVVAINGLYQGSVCDPSLLSEKAAQRVALDYGSSESSPAFLLLVSGDHVASSMALSIATWPATVRSQKDIDYALIAGPTHRLLVVECMKPVSDKAAGRTCEVVLRAAK